jgi:hypothetical protein
MLFQAIAGLGTCPPGARALGCGLAAPNYRDPQSAFGIGNDIGVEVIGTVDVERVGLVGVDKT